MSPNCDLKVIIGPHPAATSTDVRLPSGYGWYESDLHDGEYARCYSVVAKATRDADTTDYLAPPHSEV